MKKVAIACLDSLSGGRAMHTKSLIMVLMSTVVLSGCVENPMITRQEFTEYKKAVEQKLSNTEMKNQTRTEQVLNDVTRQQDQYVKAKEMMGRFVQLDGLEQRINEVLKATAKNNEDAVNALHAAQVEMEKTLSEIGKFNEEKLKLQVLISSLNDTFAKAVHSEKVELTNRLKQLDITLQNIDQIAATSVR